MKNFKLNCTMLTTFFSLYCMQALAEDLVVKAAATEFKPLVVFAQPGDTVTWTNMLSHDTVSLAGMIPEGAAAWQSKNSENFTVTLEKEGAYVYKCTPHMAQGMLGAIVVGPTQPDNLAAIDDAVKAIKANKNMVERVVRKLKKEVAAK
ncbi:MAG: plastocyanin/azurin family copper-binding protein [Gammaproteobacteria bacterium]